MNFNRMIKTAGIPLIGGIYSGLSRDESQSSFSGAFLRGSLLTGAGVALGKAGDPRFAKALQSIKGNKGMAARAAYVPAFLSHETMSWVSKHALKPTKSLLTKASKGNFKEITGMETAALAFTGYSAYEGAGILQSAGEADLTGVVAGAALFAAGKYAYMGGTYAARAYAHSDEISAGYKAYKKSSADEKDMLNMIAGKAAAASSRSGVGATSDWIKKGTIKTKADIMIEAGRTATEIIKDPQYKRTMVSMHKKNAEKVTKAVNKMFASTYHGGT